MQEIEENSVLIDVCTSCRGSFLDAGELDSFAGDPEKLRAALAEGLADGCPSKHPCPRCAKPMTEGALFDKDYRIEVCGGCGGVWFASRQLSRLARVVDAGVLSRRAPPRAVSSAAPPEGDVLSVTTKKNKAAKSSKAKPGVPGHVCPSCKAIVTAKDRWVCTCGREWDAFATEAVCGDCHREWGRIRCPRCGVEAPLAGWKSSPSR
jgi:Zn-finger nucleic acid-binding protein